MGLTKKHKVVPSIEEIAKHFGYTKVASVYGIFDDIKSILEKFGTIGEVALHTLKADGDQKIKITFDYDPDYEFMLLQIFKERFVWYEDDGTAIICSVKP